MPSSISWGLLLLAGLSCLATGCLIEDSEESDAPKHDQENSASHKIAPNLAEFAFSLYRVLAHESNTANIFFSPVSIATALGSLSLGTKADTHTQIMEGVGFNLTEISEDGAEVGTLEEPFKADHTMEQDFYVNEATTVRVPMMNRLGMFDLHYCLTLSSMVLKMKYLGNVTAIFIMPKVGRMEYVEDTLTKEFLDKLLKKDYSG
uniref:alpha-1-antitrypsin-like protein GS55-LT n=1 Tax=Ictidomys tridecemlineatus TaxID=43179 RepID=UPI001A9F156A|nr:alpha-1-antitrypsin-like protein GS55-LT [Ictidomys tridecemlineatus]